MASFKILKEISNDFEKDLRQSNFKLFSAKPVEPFEDIIAKKTRDLHLFTSKLRLLQAKQLACDPSISDQSKDEDRTMSLYSKAATQKIIEGQVVKSITQNHVVQKLVTTHDKLLKPDLLEKKQKILEILHKYSQEEKKLQCLEYNLFIKQEELLEVRKTWDQTLDQCIQSQGVTQHTADINGPLYKKLQNLVNKLEVMRWLISKLVTSRTGSYDWATDPHKRLTALALARQHHSVENFLEM